MEQNKSEDSKKVLFVGLVCVDILKIMEHYPEEDVGHRCLDCLWQRGGNASNSSTVFALLGGNVEYFGTLAETSELSFLRKDFSDYNVNIEHCIVVPNVSCPLSVVIISRSTGSRTVLHTNKNLPELKSSDLSSNISLVSGEYSWLHFEGRDNAYEMSEMLKMINKFNEGLSREDITTKRITCSLEAEKLRLAVGLEKYDMWKLPDVMFVSKDFAKSQGYFSMEEAAKGFFLKLKDGASLICAWGEHGAAAMSKITGLVTSPAFPPAEVIDTCGAGDTFNAAAIFALSREKSLQEAITFACIIAGAKCGLQGYRGVEKISSI